MLEAQVTSLAPRPEATISAPPQPRPVRLVMICGSVKPQFCGVESNTALLMSGLARRGVIVREVNIGRWTCAGVTQLLRSVRAERPDAILMPYPTLAFGRKLGPILFALIQRIAPLVVVLHEFAMVHPLRRLAASALVARAARVNITSEREKAALTAWNPWIRDRVRILRVPSNIPLRAWAPGTPTEIVVFSQLRPDKGLEAFLTCCESLTRLLPDARLRIIGSEVPRMAEYAREIRARAARTGVMVTENLDDDAVADTLSKATVALLPYPDGVSFRRASMFAAAACGVPIVTLSGPETPPELAQILQPVDSIAALIARTIHFVNDPAARMAAHAACMQIRELVSLDRILSECLATIREVAAT